MMRRQLGVRGQEKRFDMMSENERDFIISAAQLLPTSLGLYVDVSDAIKEEIARIREAAKERTAIKAKASTPAKVST